MLAQAIRIALRVFQHLLGLSPSQHLLLLDCLLSDHRTPALSLTHHRCAELKSRYMLRFLTLDIPSQVICWGHCTLNACGYSGPVDIGASSSTSIASVGTVYLGGFEARALFLGYDHSAVVLSSGNLVAWGSNSYGELGLGYSSSYSPTEPALPFPSCIVPRPTNRTVVSMCFGSDHSCILWDNGQVSCAGNAQYGQTGYGDTSTRSFAQSYSSLPFISIPRNRTVIDLSCGNRFTVITLSDGTVRSFGTNLLRLCDMPL